MCQQLSLFIERTNIAILNITTKGQAVQDFAKSRVFRK